MIVQEENEKKDTVTSLNLWHYSPSHGNTESDGSVAKYKLEEKENSDKEKKQQSKQCYSL